MKKYIWIILIIVIIIGSIIRLSPNNWDQGQHLHPDERFLTMVTNEMKLPKSVHEYFDTNSSKLNPSNLDFDFYVYGIFPLILTKVIAIILNLDNYQNINLVGRVLSGLFDVATIFFVFLIAKHFQKKYLFPPYTAILSAFFYTISVLMIQLSHFFTVDTFLQLFSISALYFSLLYSNKGQFRFVLLSGIMLGLGISSKISAVYITPVIILLVLYYSIANSLNLGQKNNIESIVNKLKINYKKIGFRIFASIGIFAVATYFTVRIFDPYIFRSINILDLQLSADFLQDISTLRSFEREDALFPPAVQWLNKTPIIYSASNIFIFGFGIFPSILMGVGLYNLLKNYKKIDLVIILFWVVMFFLYQSTQFSKTMRYFIFLFPFFSLYAAIGFERLTNKSGKIVRIILTAICLIWPLSFISIYIQPNTRVTASHFIYNTIPNNNTILVEHWDDPLPLPVENPMSRSYSILQLPVFDVDSDEKWKNMNSLLESGDYLILSSNRGWASIPTVPERYPKMEKYYEDLFTDKLMGYKKIKEITSYPSLEYIGIPLTINDDFADESFTVYDHPKVIIFEKQ